MTTHGKLSLFGPAERAIGVLAACLFVCACSSFPKGEVALDLGMKDRGVASWYGQAFHGKLTANGEVFDKTAFTAAHRKLPLGSIVRVMNLNNGRVVKVRVRDRGPFVPGRILDLSEAAARELGMVEAGTAPVQLVVLGEHQFVPPHPENRRVLILTVQSLAEAEQQSDLTPDDLEGPSMLARTMPQDLWYVRRERRISPRTCL
jgi:rare lipoprotein A